MQLKIKKKINSYILIPLSAITLSLLGLIFIYSASNYSALLTYGDEFYYVKKQALALAVGLIILFLSTKINTEIFIKLKWLIFFISVILLVLVFIPGLGSESYGATRWVDLKFITFQPSELSKFGLMVFLAAYMSENPPNKFKNVIIPLLCGGIICGLIMAEPNMSITVVVGLSLLVMLFTGGFNRKIMIVLLSAVVVLGVLLVVLEPYRMDRLTAFLDPWKNPKDEGYQLIQSYYALSSGGLFGVGLFSSRQKYLFLPFAESDFVFSIIGEETGLLGCLIVMVIFFVYIYFGIRTAKNADSFYHSLLAVGITSVTALQSVINFAVVSGCIPPTGVPLPFISSGGTSLLTFLFTSGLLYNIARNHSK